VIYLATPALIISSLSRDTIDLYLAGKVFISVCIIIGVSFVLCLGILRALKLPVKVYLPPALFANTGNMGLPLVLFAFGETGFNVAILYMVSTTILHYTLGILILNYDESPFEIFRLPLVYSAIAGVLLSVSGWTMPTSVFRAFDLLGEASIPTMIFALGYKLSEVALTDVSKSFLVGGDEDILRGDSGHADRIGFQARRRRVKGRDTSVCHAARDIQFCPRGKIQSGFGESGLYHPRGDTDFRRHYACYYRISVRLSVYPLSSVETLDLHYRDIEKMIFRIVDETPALFDV